MARYLVAASPIPGHVGPMVTVAGELRRRGHEVRVLTGARFAADVGDLPLSTLPGAAEAGPVAPRRGPNLVRRWRIGRDALRTAFLDPLAPQYAALTAELTRSDFDAVLVDSMFTGAIPLLVSGRPCPPVLVCGVGPLTLSSADCPPFGVGWQPDPGRDYTAMNSFVQQVLFRSDQRRLDAILRQLGCGPAPVFLLDWPLLADRLLQFTVPGFEYPRRDLPSSVVFTGPLPALADSAPWDSLDDDRRIVHVTQGTWDNGDFDQLLRPAFAALGDRADILIVATRGGSRAPLGPAPANARVYDFVPYARLMPHVDVMITNGGYGGVQQALGHGVPVIVAGDTADKPEVAARVAYSRAGIDLGTARPRPEAVASAVDRVLRDNSFRESAERLARDMARRSPFETIAAVLDETLETRPEHGVSVGRRGESA
ncbi:UDP:flavonoid glycosyltransferase YjiC (YdhE family) [Nocardia tenerifensis]|uniref:UDP:flavonoid glycosyltransferase YjiC (YdhE family) n=1 Tax=Nocardia tenerifensis TaxID=228006 RepID=A0A318JUX0_9NOCA|nr:nucleotide disphospho-sugar-binding domain-containing protein [Nocardia tenerifensis]PXX56345.1 UDP:flavonoid glycosyltransferase YjiC (YdhE family) [Nocardia tenerifensis]